MYSRVTARIFKKIRKKEWDDVIDAAEGRKIYDFLIKLEKYLGIEILEEDEEEATVIVEMYLDEKKDSNGFNFNKLFNEYTRIAVVNDQINSDFTDIIERLYLRVKNIKKTEILEELSNDMFFLSQCIFCYFMRKLDTGIMSVYMTYKNNKAENYQLDDSLIEELLGYMKPDLDHILTLIDKFDKKYSIGITQRLIFFIFIEHFKRRLGKYIEIDGQKENYAEETNPKYRIPDKEFFTLKEIGDIIKESGLETDEKKIQNNLRKTYSNMALSAFYSRKSKNLKRDLKKLLRKIKVVKFQEKGL